MKTKAENEWIYILKDAQLFYKKWQIDKFIELWNEGQPIAEIAKKVEFYGYDLKHIDVALLVMHCEREGLIKPRPGGLLGSKMGGARC